MSTPIEDVVYENNTAILVLYQELQELKSKLKKEEKV